MVLGPAHGQFCKINDAVLIKIKVHKMQLDHISILLLTNNSFFCVSCPTLNFQQVTQAVSVAPPETPLIFEFGKVGFC